MGVSESFGDFSEQLLEFVIGIQYSICSFHRIMLSSEACLEGKKKDKNEKTWGGNQTCSVKKGLRGGRKNPLTRQKGPGRSASEGPCDPLADKICRQNPTQGGVHSPRARRRSPWPSLGRGAGEIPFTHFGEITYSGFLEKV